MKEHDLIISMEAHQSPGPGSATQTSVSQIRDLTFTSRDLRVIRKLEKSTGVGCVVRDGGSGHDGHFDTVHVQAHPIVVDDQFAVVDGEEYFQNVLM